MRKQLIACGVLTLGLAAFGCHNQNHDENGTMPTTQQAEAAPQQDNTAIAQNDDTSATDTDAQQDEASTNTESKESVATTDDSDAESNPGADESQTPEAQSDEAQSDQAQTEEAQTDESASTDEGEQTEVAEIYDGTQFDLDEFVQQMTEASTQDPFSANASQEKPTQKKVNTASTDGDMQP